MHGKSPSPDDEISEESLGRLFPKLSPAECCVLRWLAEGKQDDDIATILSLSTRTVTTHVSTILEKFGVECRTAAAVTVWRTAYERLRDSLH